MLNLKTGFGGVGDGVADDTTAIQNWIAAMVSTGEEGYIPTGRYMSHARVLFALPGGTGNAVVIHGDGAYKSSIDVRNAPTNAGPQVHFYTGSNLPTATFPVIRDMGFMTNTPNVLCAIGLEDFSDDIGNASFSNVAFRNDNTTNSTSAVALQINYVFDSHFDNIVCVQKVGYGTALDLRASVFNTFTGGSYSNSNIGVRLADTGTSPRVSISNTFIGADFENLNVGISSEDGGAENNLFINSYMDIWRPDRTPATVGDGYGVRSIAAGVGGLVIDGIYLHPRNKRPIVDPINRQNVIVTSSHGTTNTHSFSLYAPSLIPYPVGWSKVNFPTEEWDYSDDVTSSRYTAKIKGIHHFDAALNVVGPQANAIYIVASYTNGVESNRGDQLDFGISTGILNFSKDIRLNQNDYIEIWFYNGGTAAVNLGGSTQPQVTYFNGHMVSPDI